MNVSVCHHYNYENGYWARGDTARGLPLNIADATLYLEFNLWRGFPRSKMPYQ